MNAEDAEEIGTSGHRVIGTSGHLIGTWGDRVIGWSERRFLAALGM